MFEQQTIIAERDADFDVELHAMDNAFQPLTAANAAPDNAGFELPRAVWTSMFACYAVFFGAIAMATGGSGAARFAIVISVLYTIIYFGVARIASLQAGPEARSPLEQGGMLDTWTGLMDKRAVYGQVLIVPIAVALFGISILIITISLGIGG
ncbi:hypothetical protein EH31_10200 [Erythrobacter longus]|uniref:Uncharacterized protein n=1 Tax=Erythrobacter longus TaxID=1044 RepID=A0A074MCF5_ERYLO|nr:hypothetical protein [Erythrobacter longus]KEO90450.1 hypothetical protein EH31_10200 [Erythrobacter longus]